MSLKLPIEIEANYLWRDVYLKQDAAERQKLDPNKSMGVCVGYCRSTDSLIIKVNSDNEELKKHLKFRGDFYTCPTCISKIDGEFNPKLMYMWSDRDFEPNPKIIVPAIVQKCFNHTCKKCKSPSHKIGNLFLCSNVKCKSRKLFKKFY